MFSAKMIFSPPALHIFSSSKALLFLLLFGSSDGSTSTYVTLWVLRIVTFSLLARTYLGPWVLSLLSDHIRIRSISLWSIRGIYIRTGRRTWRIERISYVWSSIDGHRRFSVKIDGGSLHVAKQEKKHVKVAPEHKRNLTLSDFNPSPLAQYAWRLISVFTALVEPFVRPMIRTYFIACLRVGIKWLPKITQAITFDLYSMIITFEEVPGAKIVIEETNLHTVLELKRMEHNPEASGLKQPANHINNRLGHGMAAWKKRLAESFQRSLDNALGDSRGSATISLKICNIMGTTPRESPSDSLKIPFLQLPGFINMGLNIKFNPKEGGIEPLGLRLSLRVGDCSAKMDLLKILVDKIFPSHSVQNRQQPILPPPHASHSFFPSMKVGRQLSPTSPSPSQSYRTSLFSPVSLFSPSTIMSNQPLFSPNSTDLILTSPRSPSSPFLQAISTSMRSHRRQLIQPSAKLKDYKDQSRISILNSVYICISSITLSAFSEAEVGPYRAQIKDIEATLVRSDPLQNSLDREHLGSGRNEQDPNAYALGLTFGHVFLQRDSDHDLMQVGKISSIEVEALIYQWPAPFLNPSPFLSNDPNAPLCALRIRFSGIHMTDRISDLQRLVTVVQHARSTDNDQLRDNEHSSILASSPLAFPIPRIYLAIECGPIIARIIYDTDKGARHRAVELRSNAISITLNAQYNHPSNSVSRYFPAASSVQALHWGLMLSANVEPILVRVRSKHDFIDYDAPKLLASDKDFLDDPPILSVGSIDISGSANAVAQIDNIHNSFAVIDMSTILVDLTTSFETIAIELWQPISVEAILRMMSLSPQSVDRQPLRSDAQPRINLPTGLTTKITVERFVIIITAPDINPHDTLELSRGFALRTGITCEYSSLRGNQEHWFDNLQRSQQRTRLLLPAEALTDAIVASKVFGPPGDKSVFMKIRFSNSLLRSSVATQYESDDPVIPDGREDVDTTKEIVRVDTFQADICVSSKQATENAQYIDTCDISLQIPLIRLYFKLVHAYSILLGLQTVSMLYPAQYSHRHGTSDQPILSPVILCHGNVTTVQAIVTLPAQELVVRIDGLSGRTASSSSPRMKWIKATVFVHLPLRANRWERPSRNKWDEFITLQSWELSYSVLAGTLCVSIDGDGGRVRIPHGFVLSDLIQDGNITFKAIKHITHMASTGCYTAMHSPEPEDPKHVPHLTIRLGSLCLEAEDDSFESKLGLIWSTAPDAVRQRNEREEAFKAKVMAILTAEQEIRVDEGVVTDVDYQFGSTHTVSIEEARRRLDDVHALDWTLRLRQAKEKREKVENSILHKLFGAFVSTTSDTLLEFMDLAPPSSDPPLLRLMLENLCLTISPPSFTLSQLPDVLYSLGSGLPRDTQFSLIVPLHIHFTLSSMTASLRNYPLPMLHIPERADPSQITWSFDTDLVIAEEMGTSLSVDWIPCPVIDDRESVYGEAAFSILVPKTIMPVKTYAAPVIRITADEPTIFSWGISYGPAIQDVMRVIDTLSSLPRDSSPHLGFWDKMRLVFHWTSKVTFSQEIRLYIKGTRDPSEVLDSGSGFVFCWQGNPEIRVGYENPQKELIQVMSESMLIAVPDLDDYDPKSRFLLEQVFSHSSKPFRKICARLSSGVRYGIGFTLERSCGPECPFCTGTPFDRKCRFFSFRPHYDIKLELKAATPTLKDENDSYKGFRSDFVHLSFSLASSTRTEGFWTKPKNNEVIVQPSNLHLTPKVFAHFWSWCSLFDGALTLPIRQGNYYTPRPISPKLGRHLATLKYRISLPNLYFMHGYMDASRETWVDGITPWIGLKGKVDELQVDMHQREEETKVPGHLPGSTRTIHRKPFYTAEVIMKGLELRAMLATFSESMKQNVEMVAPRERSNYRKHADLPITNSTSIWYDLEDFIELDWSPPDEPTLHLLPLAMCPQFTYFKLKEALSGHQQISKFGSEHSHICLLGKEPSIPRTQISLASARVDELKTLLVPHKETRADVTLDKKAVAKMIALLEDYISVLKEAEIKPEAASQRNASHNYYMPYDIGSSDDWANFDNVYQIHCPSIFMDSAVRDIMIQYYYRSRDVRGLEYHMAARAVKFIRDQANAVLSGHDIESTADSVKDKGQQNAAQIAASALRKVLRGDNSSKLPIDIIQASSADVSDGIDPLSGWSDGVSLQRSHCCILLKPQIILSTETPEDKCIVAAAQAKLESFAVMDTSNLDDPISGKIMSRNYTSLFGLQAFAPTNIQPTETGPVPLEVLVDLRCESDAFERLVPQTEAIFHYDKFNRLRLRNKITSITIKPTVTQNIASVRDSHLQDQTDLMRVHIPRFTVSANAEHFQAISNIVTKLLLFSDPVHKSRLDKLETLIFKYDFTDLNSAANVIASLQCRLRDALETERVTKRNWRRLEEDEGNRLTLLHLQAHVLLLSEELSLLFDSLKMAQDRFDDHADQKSALLLHASSSEISWRMLDHRRNLLSKLVVTNINFRWLSRQDSSTVNHLTIGDLSAFDGSRSALWTEILSKYDDPPNHPLLKRGLFLLANWTILAPVGGITIYEAFELSLHPLRLQIDAKVGRKIMEYVWPGRAQRKVTEGPSSTHHDSLPQIVVKNPPSTGRSSFDSPHGLQTPRTGDKQGLRKLSSSRSFTDLKTARESNTSSSSNLNTAQSFLSPTASMKRTHSSDSINYFNAIDASNEQVSDTDVIVPNDPGQYWTDDAQVMKKRSSQKTFILVRISSIHVLLSIVKEGSFECHEARITTRELEYRNQTSSFEELVNQFIPSNMSWRGWVKMALHQPLVPVLPVARELLAKTKWTATSKLQSHDNAMKPSYHHRMSSADDDSSHWTLNESWRRHETSSKSNRKYGWRNNKDPSHVTSLPLTDEPEPLEGDTEQSNLNIEYSSRKRVKSLFSNMGQRRPSKSRGPDKRESEDVLQSNV